MNLKEIKQTLNSGTGKELKEYLLMQLKELRYIENIKVYGNAVEQAIEIKAQKKAFEKLRNIFGEIMTIEEIDDTKKEKDEFFVM